MSKFDTKNKNFKKHKPKVAFICNHNSCRSQMAEALGKMLAQDTFKSYSAGVEIKNHINQDAQRLIKKIYGIDMEKTQSCKLITDIAKPDIVIFMGCNVNCPNLSSKYSENWELDDPSGKTDDEFKKIIDLIYKKVLELKEKLKLMTKSTAINENSSFIANSNTKNND